MIEIVGISGAVLILLAFTMSQLGKWSIESKRYDGVNAVGALLLIVYAYLLASVPFFILNVVWFVVAVRDLVIAKK